MTRAVLSVGANLGDRLAALQGVVDSVRPWLRAVSPVYETDPWGPVEQDDYLNAVLIVVDPSASPLLWLERCQAAEQAAGRTRELRWGPRTLDADVVVVDEVVSDEPELLLPHPRARERAFVLVPWLDVDPGAVLAGAPVAQLVAALPVAERDGVRLRPDLVLT